MSKKKRHKKESSVEKLYSTAILILNMRICFLRVSAYHMLVPYYSGGKEYDDVKKLALTVDKNEEEDGEPGYTVDFDALLKENPDTVAWIRFDEPSVISYPVVKSADNKEYLTKTFTANDNKLGAIFMDMRNATNLSDRNTFIYGHNLKVGGEMFSQLSEYASEEFCKEHPYFYIYTPEGEFKYQVFSAGTVKDTAENYNLTYLNDEEFSSYLQICKESSNYQVDVEVNGQSRIVSLSTCTNVNDDERFLLQGVLVEE